MVPPHDSGCIVARRSHALSIQPRTVPVNAQAGKYSTNCLSSSKKCVLPNRRDCGGLSGEAKKAAHPEQFPRLTPAFL
jgi:hypothetical protein